MRVSRAGDALIIRAAVDAGEIQLVRIVPFPPGLVAHAGPYICAPTRAGLTIPFHAWSAAPAPAHSGTQPRGSNGRRPEQPGLHPPEKRQGAPAPQACPPGTGTAQNIYAWVAAEAGTVKRLRRYLVNEVGLDPRQSEFRAYWSLEAGSGVNGSPFRTLGPRGTSGTPRPKTRAVPCHGASNKPTALPVLYVTARLYAYETIGGHGRLCQGFSGNGAEASPLSSIRQVLAGLDGVRFRHLYSHLGFVCSDFGDDERPGPLTAAVYPWKHGGAGGFRTLACSNPAAQQAFSLSNPSALP